eukprot:PhF_6_TR40224/c0_g2_i1/m.59774
MLFVLIVLFLSTQLTHQSSSSSSLQASPEVEWLVNLYTSTSTSYSWKNESGWKSSIRTMKSSDNICLWYGVQCSSNANSGGVISLSLSANRLTGMLPLSIARMSELATIDLSYNLLSGTIPVYFFMSTPSLQRLYLQGNTLSGTIPSNIGMTPLFDINLANNRFGGELPVQLLKCPLKYVDLSHNIFVGKPLIGFFAAASAPTLEVLRLQGNSFRARLQDLWKSIDPASLLTLIDLSQNYMEGEVPDTIGHFTMLVELDLSLNALRGGIPNTITALHYLQSFNISHNDLQGTIPHDMWTMSSLRCLNVENNHLRGTLPVAGIVDTNNVLRTLRIAQNDFDGNLPEYTTLTDMTTALNAWNCPLPQTTMNGWRDGPPTTMCFVAGGNTHRKRR